MSALSPYLDASDPRDPQWRIASVIAGCIVVLGAAGLYLSAALVLPVVWHTWLAATLLLLGLIGWAVFMFVTATLVLAPSRLGRMTLVTALSVSAFLMLASVTVVAALPRPSNDVPSVAASPAEDTYDGQSLTVRVHFVQGDPEVARSIAGCIPDVVDLAKLVGGTWKAPKLLFINKNGPQFVNADEPVPKRRGNCPERSWIWTAGPGLVVVSPEG